jgi:RhtB (resistance to homoserine/threonine) family protein
MSDLALAIATIALVQLMGTMSPGPSFLIVSQAAVAESRATALRLAFGLAIGTVIWAVSAMLGLKALLTAFGSLYLAMKTAGGLYLIYLAVRLWRHAADPLAVPLGREAPRSGIGAVRRGVLAQLANPKVAVFYGSVFVTMLPAETPGWAKLVVCAIVFTNVFVWYSLVALVLSAEQARARYARFKRWIDRASGSVLVLLGLRLVADRS